MAAYLVFLHHYTPSPDAVGPTLAAILREGHIGVTLFFVLSGFLIAWTYYHRSQHRQEGFWGPYLLKRVARIHPVYFALLALQWLWPGGARPDSTEAFLNITLLKGFSDAHKFTGLPQAWSLTVEETFYLCAPLLFDAARRWGLVATQAVLWAVALAVAMLNLEFTILYTFLGRSFEFVAGIGLALWIKPGRASGGIATWIGAGGCLATMVAMATLATPERPGLLHPAGMALNNVVLPLFAVSLLAGLAREETRLAKLLASRPAQFLGRVSYAFYLVHYGAMALWVFPRIAIPGWPMATWLVWLVTANVAAIVVYVAIEHPAQSALLRWSARPRAQRATMGT